MYRTATVTFAAFIAATPAFSQSLCGGAGDGGQWIGGSEGASDIAASDAHREQMALVLSGNSYVSLFSLSAPAEVRVEAAGRGNGDPVIDLYGPDGALVTSDDDSGGNGAARAELSLTPGTYCVALQSYDNSPMTAFVRVGLTSHDALTEGGGEATSSVVETTTDTGDGSEEVFGGGSCADGVSMGTFAGAALRLEGSADQNPFITFTLDAPTAVSVTASNEDADPTIAVYDASDTYIGENDDFDGLNSRIDLTTPLAPGEYCIELDALNDTGLPIIVEVSEYDPAAALAALYARGEAAPPLDGSVPVTALGTLSNRLRQDVQAGETASWFSVDVDQGGLLLIEAIAASEGGDPWVAVFDDLGRQVALNDDNGDSLDSLIAARVNAGTYLVAVKQVAGGQGFIRVLFERYVPAP